MPPTAHQVSWTQVVVWPGERVPGENEGKSEVSPRSTHWVPGSVPALAGLALHPLESYILLPPSSLCSQT